MTKTLIKVKRKTKKFKMEKEPQRYFFHGKNLSVKNKTAKKKTLQNMFDDAFYEAKHFIIIIFDKYHSACGAFYNHSRALLLKVCYKTNKKIA